VRIALVLIVLLHVGRAEAAGLPVDVELVRPTLAPGGQPGQDTPWTHSPGMPRFAALAQSEQDPVIVYADGDYAGPVVSSRTLFQVGGRWSPRERIDLSLAIPLAWQEGGILPGSTEGAALGDIEVAARYRFLGKDKSALAVRADVALPSGNTESWMGEGTVRPGGALIGALVVGKFSLLGEAGYRWAPAVASTLQVTSGPALTTNAALRYSLGRVGLGFGYLGRVRLAPEANIRDNGSALLACVDIKAPAGITVDVGGGPGLGGGVGASTVRAFLGLSWVPEPIKPPVRPVSPAALNLAPPPEEVPDVVPVPAPAIEGWAEGELAKVEGERIVIRDPIQFEFAKDVVLPESLPILHDVARVIAENPRIAYVVVEGHASEEGSYEYNYWLSTTRARAIYRVLIEAGVSPERLGYRAMGEVVPVSSGTDEASLALNRRVVFAIEKQLPSDAPAPEWPPVPVPWTGKLPRVQK
jgi:OmpA-OmpF porin, OOP family